MELKEFRGSTDFLLVANRETSQAINGLNSDCYTYIESDDSTGIRIGKNEFLDR